MSAQDRRDGTMIIAMSKNCPASQKCEFFHRFVTEEDLQSIINMGRYVESVTYTKFGTFVVYRDNTDAVHQMLEFVPRYDIEKECKKMFKKGYSLKYYNQEQKYAIFDKNPKVTKQSFVEINSSKKNVNEKISKLNQKGLYVTIIENTTAVLQNGFDGNIQQMTKTIIVNNGEELQSQHEIQSLLSEGWMISSVSKSYNHYGNWSLYRIMFDKLNDTTSDNLQLIGLVEKQEELTKFLQDNNDQEFKIFKTWCGWENRDYAHDAELAASYDTDWSGILGGLSSSLSALAGGSIGNNETGTVDNNYSSPVDNGVNPSNSRGGKVSKANHANWSSLERSYSNYESQLIRMSNTSNIDLQEVRSIQKKMRDIREKIKVQSGGHERAVSQWENWTP